MSKNPIANMLGFEARRCDFTLHGVAYEYHAASDVTCETLYRKNPGYGVGNPGFSLILTPASHHRMALGQYLAGKPGVKRAAAEALVIAA